jgi:hypothetical protein
MEWDRRPFCRLRNTARTTEQHEVSLERLPWKIAKRRAGRRPSSGLYRGKPIRAVMQIVTVRFLASCV